MNEQATKHTTGPWSVEDWNYSEPGREHVPVIRTCADAIAEALPLWNASVDREPERLANARLIAAAPDLLAALKEVYELCGEVLKRQPNAGEYAHNMAVGLRWKVSTAIKRAEGDAE